jgi:hypothetical protein
MALADAVLVPTDLSDPVELSVANKPRGIQRCRSGGMTNE